MDKKYIERPAPMSDEERRKSHIKASNKYNQTNYKKFQTNLKPDIAERINNYCTDMGISKADFLKLAIDIIEDRQ